MYAQYSIEIGGKHRHQNNFDQRRMAIYVLIGLTLLGAFLRFYLLGARSLFLDEGFMVEFGRVPFYDVLIGKATATNQIVFPYILSILAGFLGYSEFSIRFLPALAGTLLIPSTYLLARIFLAEKQSLLVATLVALSPIAIAYSQEAANYSVGMLLISIYLRHFILFLRTNKLKFFLYFIVLATLAIYLHLYHLLVIFALAASSILYRGKHNPIMAAILALVIVIILSMPAILINYRVLAVINVQQPANINLSFAQILSFIEQIASSWLHGPVESIYVPQAPQSIRPLLRVIFYPIMLWIVIFNLITGNKDIRLLLVIIAIYCGAAIYLATKSNYLFERYFLVLLPLFYILLVRSFPFSGRNKFANSVSFGVIGLVIIHFSVIWSLSYDKPLWKSDWKTTIGLLRQSIHQLGLNQKFAILVPVNYESAIAQFYLSDLRKRILWDDEYQAYPYKPQLSFLSPDAMRQYNLNLLASPLVDESDVIYILTERGRDQIPYITQKLSGHFYGAGVYGGHAQLYIFKRCGSSCA